MIIKRFKILSVLSLCWFCTGLMAQDLSQLSEDEKTQLLLKLSPELTGRSERPEQADVLVNEGSESTVDSRFADVLFLPDSATNEFGGEGLQPYGYDFFKGQPSTFAPTSDAPVPNDYKLGPGDQLKISLYGKDDINFDVFVDRSGAVHPLGLGPVYVAGLAYRDAVATLTDRLQESRVGAQVDIQLGKLRSIKITVAGESKNPGTYTVSALTRITHALYVSGGVSSIGSLRNIKVVRAGDVINTLDLYDLFLRGDTSADSRLSEGDVVFVPTVGRQVGVSGAVRRPAVYELTGEKYLPDVITLAGGIEPGARVDKITVRSVKDGFTSLSTVSEGNIESFKVAAGDIAHVLPASKYEESGVRLSGMVRWPGLYSYSDNDSLAALIPSRKQLVSGADLQVGILLRRDQQTTEITAHYFSLEELFQQPSRDESFALAPGDEVFVLRSDEALKSAGFARGEVTEATSGIERVALMESLSERIRANQQRGVPHTVLVRGNVRFPGEIPLDLKKASVAELIRIAGGTVAPVNLTKIDVVRPHFNMRKLEESNSKLFSFDMQGAEGFQLQPGDTLFVRTASAEVERRVVTLDGEFNFPGEYILERGDTIADVFEKAGGLRDGAFLEGAMLLRPAIAALEEERLEKLKRRLSRELSVAALTGSAANGTMSIAAARQLIDQISQYEALGRVVLDIESQIMSADPTDKVSLKDGDRLYVPKQPDSVVVTGEVQFATAHIWSPGKRAEDFLRQSGGFTRLADNKRLFLIRANGSVQPFRVGWFSRGPIVERGDVIVVPFDTSPLEPFEIAAGVGQLVYQMAIGAAAVISLGGL